MRGVGCCDVCSRELRPEDRIDPKGRSLCAGCYNTYVIDADYRRRTERMERQVEKIKAGIDNLQAEFDADGQRDDLIALLHELS